MQVSLNYLAELTEMDRRRVTRALADLPFADGPNRAKNYDSAAALRILYAGGDGGRLDPGQERAMLDRVRREALEMDNARKKRELIPKDEVAEAWAGQIAIAKGRLLSLPSRVSGEVMRLKTQREVEHRIKDEIITILEELSRQASETPSN